MSTSTRVRWAVWVFVAGSVLTLAVRFRPESSRDPIGVSAHLRGSTTPIRGATVAGLQAAVVAAADARSARAQPLFSYVQPENAGELTRLLPAPTHAMHYVRVTSGLADGKASPFWQAAGEGRVVLPLAEGGALTVAIGESEMLGVNRFTSRGVVEGRPQSRVVFAYNEGFFHASVEDPELGEYVLRVASAEYAQFYRVDPALVPPCGGEVHAQLMAEVTGSPDLISPPTAAAAPANAQRAEVHIMMVYTPSVLSSMTGASRINALQNAYDQAIARVNVVFDDSNITARMKLVKIWETQYAEASQSDALDAVRSTSDGQMDEVHAVRDQVGADLVCLTLARQDSSSAGIGYLNVDPYYSRSSSLTFSVIEYGLMSGSRVLAHELGHNFGCAHDRDNSKGSDGSVRPGAYSYSFGYRFQGSNGAWYRDVMGYPYKNSAATNPTDRGPLAQEVARFSNPDIVVSPANVPMGVREGQPGETNAALTIEKVAFVVSTYRLQKQGPVDAGTMINVSTRAFIGTGDEVLIAGFVVQGSQPKRMLVRAAGPGIRTQGVTDAISDPKLSIVPLGASEIAANDNWGDSPDNLATVARQVGAFDFAAGSRDAAVLLLLPPGAYTAIAEGVGGATGSGLVEAYEVDGAGSRIVNLSTRGYVAFGKEMIGGLVIRGAAGSTKRVLLRVRGPSLGREPFNIGGALDDPMITVHNAKGDFLAENDDWAMQNASGTTDGFQPLVQYYSEQQISATGFAPNNRREPAILADFAPGVYTVIVRPFEDLSDGQVGRPGVAIIEAYEISQ